MGKGNKMSDLTIGEKMLEGGIKEVKMKKVCIYHDKCADGFASAWVVRKALGADNVEFYPGKYQEPPPEVDGRDVIIVDFSYKKDVLVQMASTANSILILDHHKTAQEDLVDLPDNVTAIFDMNRSGCIITWDHFYPEQSPPTLLLCIQDRDLWRFACDTTRDVMACLFSHPYDFECWDELMGGHALTKMKEEGAAINRKHMKDVVEIVGLTMRLVSIGGYTVPVANVPPSMASDAGHCLLDVRGGGIPGLHPPFAATYYDTQDGRVFSLRSKDSGVDVSQIAKLYGGGGHRNAAGFKVSFLNASLFEFTQLASIDARS